MNRRQSPRTEAKIKKAISVFAIAALIHSSIAPAAAFATGTSSSGCSAPTPILQITLANLGKKAMLPQISDTSTFWTARCRALTHGLCALTSDQLADLTVAIIANEDPQVNFDLITGVPNSLATGAGQITCGLLTDINRNPAMQSWFDGPVPTCQEMADPALQKDVPKLIDLWNQYSDISAVQSQFQTKYPNSPLIPYLPTLLQMMQQNEANGTSAKVAKNFTNPQFNPSFNIFIQEGYLSYLAQQDGSLKQAIHDYGPHGNDAPYVNQALKNDDYLLCRQPVNWGAEAAFSPANYQPVVSLPPLLAGAPSPGSSSTGAPPPASSPATANSTPSPGGQPSSAPWYDLSSSELFAAGGAAAVAAFTSLSASIGADAAAAAVWAAAGLSSAVTFGISAAIAGIVNLGMFLSGLLSGVPRGAKTDGAAQDLSSMNDLVLKLTGKQMEDGAKAGRVLSESLPPGKSFESQIAEYAVGLESFLNYNPPQAGQLLSLQPPKGAPYDHPVPWRVPKIVVLSPQNYQHFFGFPIPSAALLGRFIVSQWAPTYKNFTDPTPGAPAVVFKNQYSQFLKTMPPATPIIPPSPPPTLAQLAAEAVATARDAQAAADAANAALIKATNALTAAQARDAANPTPANKAAVAAAEKAFADAQAAAAKADATAKYDVASAYAADEAAQTQADAERAAALAAALKAAEAALKAAAAAEAAHPSAAAAAALAAAEKKLADAKAKAAAADREAAITAKATAAEKEAALAKIDRINAAAAHAAAAKAADALSAAKAADAAHPSAANAKAVAAAEKALAAAETKAAAADAAAAASAGKALAAIKALADDIAAAVANGDITAAEARPALQALANLQNLLLGPGPAGITAAAAALTAAVVVLIAADDKDRKEKKASPATAAPSSGALAAIAAAAKTAAASVSQAAASLLNATGTARPNAPAAAPPLSVPARVPGSIASRASTASAAAPALPYFKAPPSAAVQTAAAAAAVPAGGAAPVVAASRASSIAADRAAADAALSKVMASRNHADGLRYQQDAVKLVDDVVADAVNDGTK